MPKEEKKGLILVKKEVTYGLDPVPTASANAVLSSAVAVDIIDESIKREVLLPQWGKLADIPLYTGVKLSFSAEVKGSGTKNVATRLSPLLQASGLKETVGTVSVGYTAQDIIDDVSCTIYFYNDGILWKVSGCVVNACKFSGKANGKGVLQFEVTGLWKGNATSLIDASFPAIGTINWGDAVTPPVIRSAGMKIDSVTTLIADAIEIAIANNVIKRPDVNSALGINRYSIIGREITGSIDPEVVSLATYNPTNLAENATLGDFEMQVGATDGNIVKFEVPNVAKKVPKMGARDGVRTYALSFESIPKLDGTTPRITITTK